MGTHSGLLFWDLDGTLIDSVQLKGEFFARAFGDYPSYHTALLDFHQRNGGLPRTEKIQLMASEVLGVSLPDDDLARRAAVFGSLTDRHLKEAPLAPGAATTLAQLAESFSMHVVTAMPESEAGPLLEHHRLATYFDSVCGFPTRKADAVASVMAHTQGLLRAAVIGDSHEDAEVAIQAGLTFLQVRLNDAEPLPEATEVFQGLEGAAPRIKEIMGVC